VSEQVVSQRNRSNARAVLAKRVVAVTVAGVFLLPVLFCCLRDKLSGRACRLAEWGDA
jgi:hypothetical protein